jgi:hypothetical protein
MGRSPLGPDGQRRVDMPEWTSWCSMRRRCNSPFSEDYKHYGGRGITVCPSWLDFDNFYKDMGLRPTLKHSLDRRDVNGNYEKGNCRWATTQEQSENKRISQPLGGHPTLTAYAKAHGLDPSTIHQRIRRGWSREKALLQTDGRRTRNA